MSLQLMQHLLEKQRDFDYVDENALASAMTLEKGAFINLSGQAYSAVIIPSAMVISEQALNRLRSFASTGGKVIVMGDKPSLVVDQSFRDATDAEDFNWAIHEPSGELTMPVLEALPEPDVKLDKTIPEIKYTHRKLADAELYFFFNEGTEPLETMITLEGSGKVQEWDALSGDIRNMDIISSKKRKTTLKLELDRYGTKFIMIR